MVYSLQCLEQAWYFLIFYIFPSGVLYMNPLLEVKLDLILLF